MILLVLRLMPCLSLMDCKRESVLLKCRLYDLRYFPLYITQPSAVTIVARLSIPRSMAAHLSLLTSACLISCSYIISTLMSRLLGIKRTCCHDCNTSQYFSHCGICIFVPLDSLIIPFFIDVPLVVSVAYLCTSLGVSSNP